MPWTAYPAPGVAPPRLIVLVVALLILGILGVTWHYRMPERFLALLAFIFLLAQAVLGGLTVLLRLRPLVVAVHQGMGLVFFGSLVILTVQGSQPAVG